ncbi:OLC1v1038438C1 [Oldenlandia corymbosa var. corymbosa]|uniref:OLC1v1038438C1 n=1 Tax=Oldenlandia corymbosa var. corymbosa TaxID=529605 RepID=A0AAV1D2W6_OLDCO|nr:OLC1v1038438C1 [Oldenlandia corymbosa var. corymbosa]
MSESPTPTPDPSSSSISNESQKRRMKYMLHKYTSPNPAITCVFRVPNLVKETKPEAYLPQLIGLGPYHHFRPEVQLRSTKKRKAIESYVKRYDINLDSALVFNDRAMVSRFESMIRSSYDRYVDLDEETLCWITMVDVVVLSHFVDTYLDPEMKKEQQVYPDMEKLVPDLFMMENQIPFTLVIQAHECLGLAWSAKQKSGILRHFFDFCVLHSPLELKDSSVWKKVKRISQEGISDQKITHMLHLMYLMIIKSNSPVVEAATPTTKLPSGGQRDWLTRATRRVKGFAGLASSKARDLFRQVVEEFNSAVHDAQSSGVRIPGNIQKVSLFLGNLDKAIKLNERSKSGDFSPEMNLEIPSASRLSTILDVKFKPLPPGCGIHRIELKEQQPEDGNGFLFYLPRIKFGPTSDVIIRNLVAYESTISKEERGRTRFRDFIYLICGLIRSEQDVKLLKDAGIIEPDKSIPDSEIARIFKGLMDIEGTTAPESKVLKVVQKAHKNYSDLIVIKYGRSFMNHFAAMLKVFRGLFPLMIFLFLAFQSFCDVYDCRARPTTHGSSLIKDNSSLDLNAAQEIASSSLMMPRKLLLSQ